MAAFAGNNKSVASPRCARRGSGALAASHGHGLLRHVRALLALGGGDDGAGDLHGVAGLEGVVRDPHAAAVHPHAASVDDRLGLFAELRTVFDIRAEDIARGNVGNVILCCDHFCLCTLTGTRST